MSVFEHCSILLELKTLPFKEKQKLKSAVTENGGDISYVVNKQCTLIVTSDVANLSSNRLRGIQRYQTPVVGVAYVYGCLERGVLLPVDDYKLDASSPSASSSPPLPPSKPTPAPITRQAFKVPAAEPAKCPPTGPTKCPTKGPTKPVDSVPGLSQRAESGNVLEKCRIYTETDSDLPTYPDHFQVAKYSIFEKISSNTWCVLELQSHKGEKGWKYRVVKYWKDDVSTEKAAVRDTLVFPSTSEEALEVFKSLRETLTAAGLLLRTNTPPQAPHLGSAPLQQLLLEEKLNTGSLSQEVGVFVELLWTEALGLLNNVLRVPIDKLSLNDVSRADGLLLLAQRKFRENDHAAAGILLDEVYTLLLHVVPFQHPPTAKLISQKLDLCQLIRDVLNVSEMTLSSPVPSSLGKYRALRCSIETVPPDTAEFQAVTALLQDRRVQVRQVLRVSRGVELQTFKSEVGNMKPLLHSSSPSNFVGVLSRGLLLPRVGVEHHGIERTDVGNLGSGIYFSDAISTCLKYSKPSETDGSRLLLVCDVALGRCRDMYKRDITLTRAPEGHHSTHGVRRTRNAPSEFDDDEYVVYSPDQVKLKYVVQFSVEGDQLKEFSPAVDTSAEPAPPSSDPGRGLTMEDDEVESIKNPLADVKAGLLDSSGQQLPLQAVHVKCKLMDLLSQVIIFQKYSNRSSVPIEAKYVFPLDDCAAVCGFEAFINGKHVVGQVKEKETARREYKQAIEKGHGAYLMDQDAPDVFTISVGNLPPGATVLIKVTFVCELIVRDGSILFSLPGSVAPWQESAALNQTTQVTVEKVCVTDEARDFTLDMSVEMPNKITDLQCITHKVKIKRTDCKAVVSVLPGEVMGQDGFQLSITLSEVHLPRMWVEKHPHKDSQASMLVFYPDFEVNSTSASDEVVLLVDASESMKGESLRVARRIAWQVLKTLGRNLRLNVIFFGTDHTEAFLTARPLAEARPAAERFIKLFSPAGGSTELWRPLRALGLLPPSRGVRNLLLLSDGHVQNAELTLQLLRDNARHSRLFACGLGPTANQHMLRALAQAGGGAFEYFDTKTKHNWAEKVACQVKRMASPGCSSVSVKWQQFNPTAPPPVQAPKQLHALFNDCHTLVYGFVPHCTQATLLGNLSGRELKTMVSTSELQKTRGTFLHKLTARALIRDYEDGSLDSNEAEHEGKKAELKHFIIELSKEFSILSQFTSFVAIEERDSKQTEEGFTDIPKLISEEDVDFLPYISWISPQHSAEKESMAEDEEEYIEEYEEEYMDESTEEDEEESTEEDEEESMEEDEEESMEEECLQSISVEEVEEILVGSCSTKGDDDDDWGECAEDRSFSLLDSSVPQMMNQTVSPSYFPTSASSSSLPYLMSAGESRLESDEVPWAEKCFGAPFLSVKFDMPPPGSALPPPPPPPPPKGRPQFLASPGPPPPPLLQHSLGFSSHPPAPPPPPCTGGPPSISPKRRRSARLGLAFGSVSFGPQRINQAESSALFSSAETSPLFGSMGGIGTLQIAARPQSYSGIEGGRSSLSSMEDPEPASRTVWRGRMTRSLRRHTDEVSSDSLPTDSILTSADSTFSYQQQHQQQSGIVTDKSLFSQLKQSTQEARPILAHQQSGFGFGGSLPQTQSLKHHPRCGSAAFTPPLETDFSSMSVMASKKSLGKPQSHRALVGKVRDSGYPEKLSLRVHQPPVRPDAEQAVAASQRFKRHSLQPPLLRTSSDPEGLQLKWTKIFQMQHLEGYWELTTELGELMNVNVDLFANVFLKNKGIQSLGVRAHADILRLVATLLVLQLMRVEKLEEGKLLRTLFSPDEYSLPRPARWAEVKRAVDWVCWADRQYPCVYSRLEFGLSWETSTRQLLGFEGLPPFSALTGLKLQKTVRHLLVL